MIVSIAINVTMSRTITLARVCFHTHWQAFVFCICNTSLELIVNIMEYTIYLLLSVDKEHHLSCHPNII